MALRAFRGTFLIAIDEDNVSDEVKGHIYGTGPTTVEVVKDFCQETITIDCSTDSSEDYVGFVSAQIDFESLTELEPEEIIKIYKG